MKEEAVILIASDDVSDAQLVRRVLQDEFDHLVLSTDPDKAVTDFVNHRPRVLVLAFKTLEKAERYYFGLYRFCDRIQAMPHRTLTLCNREDLKAAYELCKREHFDDYILFWPASLDAFRLPMAVHQALRQMKGEGEPSASEIAIQARQVFGLQAQMMKQIDDGEQHVDNTSRSVDKARDGILSALDEFFDRMSKMGPSEPERLAQLAGLRQAFEEQTREEILNRFETVDQAVQPLQNWAAQARDELATLLESARLLDLLSAKVRPLLLVVDDDRFQHRLLAHMLSEIDLEIVFTVSGAEAMGTLRRHRPDIILMDIGLPDGDGIEIIRRIKSVDHYADIPVIMITGHREKSIVMESMQAGAVDFLVKPFDRQILLEKFHKLLNGQHPHSEPSLQFI